MGSDHCLTEINIWVKFIENRSKGSGDMEQTQNSEGKTHALECDFDLESVSLSHELCTTTR